jgi:hypothetical protein
MAEGKRKEEGSIERRGGQKHGKEEGKNKESRRECITKGRKEENGKHG